MLTAPHEAIGAAPLALIVDRDEDSRLLYTEFLEINHWRVIGAAGGPEALAKAIAERPDVVISETLLPGFDGLTLSELLRTDYGTAHIPLIFVTSDATAVNLGRAAASGAQAVLTKPCLPETLLNEINAVVHRSREVRMRATMVQAIARTQLDRVQQAIESAKARQAAVSLKKAFLRGDTVVPPITPPTLTCPACDARLRYVRSHVGGVSVKHREQWDYFECPRCGVFEYRVRTKRLKKSS